MFVYRMKETDSIIVETTSYVIRFVDTYIVVETTSHVVCRMKETDSIIVETTSYVIRFVDTYIVVETTSHVVCREVVCLNTLIIVETTSYLCECNIVVSYAKRLSCIGLFGCFYLQVIQVI
jgi:hypothetical protein